MKYYDITFHELSGKNVIKRSVPSDKANFDAWQDACVSLANFGQWKCGIVESSVYRSD